MIRKDWILLAVGVFLTIALAGYVFLFSDTNGLENYELDGRVDDQQVAKQRSLEEAKSKTQPLVTSQFKMSPAGVKCFLSEKDRISDSMSQLQHDKKMKYFAYRQLFEKAGVGEKELVTRLVYSESLASRCDDSKLQEVFQSIFWVIKNRILQKGGIASEVVFQYNQFASSLHDYGDSMMHEFLCPSQSKVWREIDQFVGKNLNTSNNNEILSIPKDGYNFFLFQHSSKPVHFSEKHWTKTFPVFKEIMSGGKVCVRFYRNRFYK